MRVSRCGDKPRALRPFIGMERGGQTRKGTMEIQSYRMEGDSNKTRKQNRQSIGQDRANSKKLDRTTQRETSKQKGREAKEAQTNQSFFYWGLFARMT